MHCNAQRAMVGIGIYRVNVGHLHHGQQGQQDKTHYRGSRQGTGPCAAIPAQKCLQSDQHTNPCFKNTRLLDASVEGKVRFRTGFSFHKTGQPSLDPCV
jgi:hypothetical protein